MLCSRNLLQSQIALIIFFFFHWFFFPTLNSVRALGALCESKAMANADAIGKRIEEKKNKNTFLNKSIFYA